MVLKVRNNSLIRRRRNDIEDLLCNHLSELLFELFRSKERKLKHDIKKFQFNKIYIFERSTWRGFINIFTEKKEELYIRADPWYDMDA